MRNMLALVGAAVVVFLGVGWKLDWFHVQRSASSDGKQHYNVEVDTSKIGADIDKGKNKLHTFVDRKDEKKSEPLPMPPLDEGKGTGSAGKSPFNLTSKPGDKTPELPGVDPESLLPKLP